NVKGAFVLVLGLSTQIQSLFLYGAYPGRQLTGDRRHAAIYLVPRLVGAERHDRQGHESQADVAHPSATAYSDAGKILLFELGKYYRQPFVDGLGVVSHFAQEVLQHGFVVDQVGSPIITRRPWYAESQRLPLL